MLQRVKLKTAFYFGADAVYVGLKKFSARASAMNFDGEELKEAVKYCHTYGVKVHVTLNTLVYENEYGELFESLKQICEAGADAMLVVTPYYNKATQNGLYEHFKAMADVATCPVILYNVPSRTGCNLKPETVLRLSEHPMIVGIKEASGDLSQVATLAALCGDKIDIYSGNDDQILPILSLGGKGVISVLSNLLPGQTDAICKKFFDGDLEGAKDLQLKYLPLIHLLFCEVNPIPVKAAMKLIGYDCGDCRLPLAGLSKENMAKIEAFFK